MKKILSLLLLVTLCSCYNGTENKVNHEIEVLEYNKDCYVNQLVKYSKESVPIAAKETAIKIDSLNVAIKNLKQLIVK